MKAPSLTLGFRNRANDIRVREASAFAEPHRKWTSATAHVSALAIIGLGAGTILSGVVGLGYDAPDWEMLLVYGLAIVAGGGLLWRFTRAPERMTRLQAFFTVSATWVILCAVAAVPFMLAGTFDTPVNAWFESVSGLTSAGSTVLADIEATGKAMRFYRQYIQFISGAGIVLLAVAVLAQLGVGGLELAETEIAGPAAEGKIAPRVKDVARRIWTAYILLVVGVAVALLLVGVGPYDAVTHAMSTISTAGFSTFNDSISHFDSAVVEFVLIVGMFAGALNFSLHYRAMRSGPGRYFHSPEFRTYLWIFLGAIALVTLINFVDGMPFFQSLRESSFNVTTLLTTCGFGTSDFTTWAPVAQLILLGCMLCGGMTGSTAGGLKMIRIKVLVRFAWREIKRVRHPRGVFVIRLGKDTVPERVVSEVMAFVMMYILAVIGGVIVVTMLGTDLMTSLGGVAGTLGLVGPGMGDAGPHSNFLVFSEPARAVLSGLMLLGRMEIIALLLAFTVPYRRAHGARQRITS